MTEARAALVDTDVFSILYVSRRITGSEQRARRDAWEAALSGTRVVISFMTRAELLVGARSQGWGSERLRVLTKILTDTPTVSLDQGVMDAYVDLSVACRRRAHPLHQKVHTADRWIAACALALDLPLLSGDGVVAGAPGLALL